MVEDMKHINRSVNYFLQFYVFENSFEHYQRDLPYNFNSEKKYSEKEMKEKDEEKDLIDKLNSEL